MLASTWQDLCTAMQRREAVGSSRGKGGMAPEDFKAISAARFPCAVCQGRTLPPGLELITQEEAEQMARTTKRGTCELCGVHANVGMNHGSMVCNNCTHLQSAVANRLPAVAAAAQAMRKTEELLGHLIPAGGLAVKVTADLLQEISGIVEYKGEDPAELVAAVRKRVLTCASCDAEDVLHEIREIVGYSADMGDKGLADAVRAFSEADCENCLPRGFDRAEGARLRSDLLRACGLDLDLGVPQGWDYVTAAAIQTIAGLLNRRDDLLALLTMERAVSAELRNEIARLNGQTHSESEQVTALRSDLIRSSGVIEQLRAELTLLEQAHDEWEQRAVQAESNIANLNERNRLLHNHVGLGESQLTKLRAELTLAQQARDEWEQRAVQAESNVETMEAELQERDRDEDRSFNRIGLLDIAIAALRGDAVPADQIAGLLAIARKVAA